MILEKGTGVPNYVAHLYRKCLEVDPANQYVFFQPDRSRTLGVTQVARTPRGLLGAAWFDCLRVQRLIRRANLDVFHGPSHFLPLRKFAGIKYVVTVHDLALMPHYHPTLAEIWTYPAEELAAQISDVPATWRGAPE